ncbi:hypothetical protein GCM10027432_24970 [Lysobacter fragariae]
MHAVAAALSAAGIFAGDLNAEAVMARAPARSICSCCIRGSRASRRAALVSLCVHETPPCRESGDVVTPAGDVGPKAEKFLLDYLLPSRGLNVRDGAVSWPQT